MDNSSKTITSSIEKLTDLKLDNSTDIVKVDEERLNVIVDEFKRNAEEDLMNDYEFARKNIRSLLEKGMSAVDGAIQLVKESESPRVYEATSTFIKTLAELNKDLIALHEAMQKHHSIKDSDEVKSVTNNATIFVGSSEELINIFKKKNIIDQQH